MSPPRPSRRPTTRCLHARDRLIPGAAPPHNSRRVEEDSDRLARGREQGIRTGHGKGGATSSQRGGGCGGCTTRALSALSRATPWSATPRPEPAHPSPPPPRGVATLSRPHVPARCFLSPDWLPQRRGGGEESGWLLGCRDGRAVSSPPALWRHKGQTIPSIRHEPLIGSKGTPHVTEPGGAVEGGAARRCGSGTCGAVRQRRGWWGVVGSQIGGSTGAGPSSPPQVGRRPPAAPCQAGFRECLAPRQGTGRASRAPR